MIDDTDGKRALAVIKNLPVTCVVYFQDQGVFAHATLSSLEKSRAYAASHGVDVQLVLILDAHDDLTCRIVSEHSAIKSDDVVTCVTYANAAASRNHAMRFARGEYVIFVDGDCCCPADFMLLMARKAELDAKSIIYPEYQFDFGVNNTYVKLGGPDDALDSMYALFSKNWYGFCFAAHRDIFLRMPFIESAQSFENGVWHWICEAVASGLRLVSAQGGVVFLRHRSNAGGPTREHGCPAVFSSEFFASLPPPEKMPEAPPASSMPAPLLSKKALAREAIIACLRSLPAGLAERIYAKLKRVFGGAPPPAYPHAIQKALDEVAAVEGMLHPRVLPQASPITPHYDVLPGKVYASVWQELQGRSFDVVYMVPHIGVGGADLMARNYMGVMRRLGKRVLCLLVCDVPRDLGTVPEGVTVVRFGRVARCLSVEQRRFVLGRLLLQLEPTVIHAVTDWLSFEVLQIYGEALKYKSRLCASIFADAQDVRDTHFGAGTQYLRGLMGRCATVITDNTVTAREWHGRLGLPLDFFQPVYGVADVSRSLMNAGARGKRILWSGRLDKEKRLDVLLAIAQALPEMHFDVYGQAVLDKDSTIEALEQLPNVTLCGGYRNFYDLPLQQYAALVYTTQNEGLPNVLLEGAACGLPLIAPDRGGIADFVSDETGWLIASHTDVAAYVRAIQAVLVDPAEADRRAQGALDLLRRRHTQEAFSASLLRAYGLSSCEEEPHV